MAEPGFKQFKFFGFSDVGKVRKHNEDSYLCNEGARLFLVADGMGGHASGETASQMAISRVEEYMARSRSEEACQGPDFSETLAPEQNRLLAATRYANQRIYELAGRTPSMKGMGTTIVGVVIDGNHLAVVNVGDTRLYRVRQGELEQITEDHTLVGEQQRMGILTREEARRHAQRHILTSALGIYRRPRIDVLRPEIAPSDLYIICSDGLHDMLENDEILRTITAVKDQSLYKIGISLVLKANLEGGLDNITVVLLSFVA
jgi:serine/threonine protein phosphatase PrpC